MGGERGSRWPQHGGAIDTLWEGSTEPAAAAAVAAAAALKLTGLSATEGSKTPHGTPWAACQQQAGTHNWVVQPGQQTAGFKPW